MSVFVAYDNSGARRSTSKSLAWAAVKSALLPADRQFQDKCMGVVCYSDLRLDTVLCRLTWRYCSHTPETTGTDWKHMLLELGFRVLASGWLAFVLSLPGGLTQEDSLVFTRLGLHTRADAPAVEALWCRSQTNMTLFSYQHKHFDFEVGSRPIVH